MSDTESRSVVGTQHRPGTLAGSEQPRGLEGSAEALVELGGSSTVRNVLRQQSRPFTAEWEEGDASALFEIAGAYLRTVWSSLSLRHQWLDDLIGSHATTAAPHVAASSGVLRWLPFNPGQRSQPGWDLRNSYWVERRDLSADGSDGPILDRTAVLLACMWRESGNGVRPVFNEQGLRVVMHVEPPRQDRKVRVRVTGLSISLRDPEHAAAAHPELQPPLSGQDHERFSRAGTSQQLQASSITFGIFKQDPVSKFGSRRRNGVRPSSSSADLSKAKDKQTFQVRVGAARTPRMVLENEWVRVVNSRFADRDSAGQPKPPDDPKEVPLEELDEMPVRSNAFAALNAFWHARDFFERIVAYGFAPERLLRFFEPPLLINYRGSFRHAKTGRTVNAGAYWKVAPHYEDDTNTLKPGRVEVRFALADLRVDASGEALGLACDPRWNWHEFGHVLSMGALGERELRFAHSVGDAMSAITSDCDSQLALNDEGRSANDAPWRGVTFPWVGPLRRHDRKAEDGWGWQGPFYGRTRFFVGRDGNDKAEYWAEQILSSTLFKFYRAIGGDAQAGDQPDRDRRAAAGAYTVYLIMRGVALLGPAHVVPARTPHEFMSALIDADVGTLTSPRGAEPFFGGMVHKVIEWAFAAQGLDAAQRTDVYLDDGRAGTYDPIDVEPEALPRAKAIRVQEGADDVKEIYVSIRSSATAAADEVEVSVWTAEHEGSTFPYWGSQAWKKLGVQRVESLARDAGIEVGPFRSTLKGSQAVLAVVSCAADPANVDPRTSLPCATGAPIRQLAHYDNNMALTSLSFR